MLLVRTDANATIGIGHAMRSLAIAEAWLELGFGDVVFAMRDAPPAVRARIERAGARIVWPAPAAPYVVADGYLIDAAEKAALARDARLLIVDDRGESVTSAAAVVVNPNPAASRALYAHVSCTVLVGGEYALLRREFREPSTRARTERVLVSFGGADVANLMPRALAALADLDVEVLAIAGPANVHAAALHASRPGIQIVPSVDNIAGEMRASSLAIVAAGGTCWELAALGVPMIAAVVAENQRDVAAAVESLGLGVALRDDPSAADFSAAVARMDPASRAEMARRGPQIIDGKGALRVCEVLRGER